MPFRVEEHVAQLPEVLASTTNGKVDLNGNGDDARKPLVMDDLILNLDSDKWAGSFAERLLGQKIPRHACVANHHESRLRDRRIG